MKQNPHVHSEKHLKYLENLPKKTLLDILENCYNEIFVNDGEGSVVYVNPACVRHYGIKPEDFIGMKNQDVFQGKWTPMVLDYAIKEKRTIFAKQRFIPADEELVTILTPVLSEDKSKVELIIGAVQERTIDHWDVSYKEDDLKRSRKGSRFKSSRVPIISHSFNYWEIITELRQVAQSTIPVLLLGESGTGKTHVAEYIHENSGREGLFISLNCTAISETLLESELFGYVAHAFTGASSKGKIGLIEMANNGTLFLDEIGDIPLHLQAKLLDVLENQRFIPVGSNKMEYVNIRIITATNKDMKKLVSEGKFREDLYWRISTFHTVIPPLRERKNDILPMAKYYLKMYNEKYKKTKKFTSETVEAMMTYDWPGNVRQLKNVVERLVVTTIGNSIEVQKLPEEMRIKIEKEKDLDMLEIDERTGSFDELVERYKRKLVEESYKENNSVRELAQALEITPSKAHRLIKRYGLDGVE
ncbi:sigma-54 interaction domain-containing protein [Alkalibacter mobilis]|uniref:sigma-54 interaction domain-containing protein n=1 Tax=Alkalibacter mobilis TaxID=2787712 RepID=UPI00189D94B9|nr:sigma 54-interacting transcriptional regulator [Alkalibacter mobilis]MBF7095640.1 sigma 54-interacting transcriptional regulator [Alkalibacter mobilis]